MYEFDDPNKEITVPLYTEPDIPKDFTDEERAAVLAEWECRQKVQIKIRRSLKHREAWSHRLLEMGAKDKKRIRDKQKEYTREDCPYLYDDGYMTEEGKSDRNKLAREILMEILIRTYGFKIGDRQVDDMEKKEEQIDGLDYTDQLITAMIRAMAAQRPTARQSLSSGS